MEKFIRKYIRLFISAGFLYAGIVIMGYSLTVMKYEGYEDGIKYLSSFVEKENKALSELVEKNKGRENLQGKGVSDLPGFLTRVNDLARENKIILLRVEPDENRINSYSIQFTADYDTLLRFSASLESLDVVVEDVEIRPYDDTEATPQHVIQFVITPKNNATKIAGEALRKLMARIDEKGKRNPFQRLVSDRGNVQRKIRLTYLYHLSGISRIGNDRYATINDLEFSVGDELDGMKIVRIRDELVELEKMDQGSKKKYILGFREENKKEGGGR